MDRSCVITLLSVTRGQDANGVWRDSTPVKRDVYAQVNSVTRAEFFAGGRSGLNPDLMFTMFFADYNNEKTVIYNGKPYSVYRVYHGRTDKIELYVEREGGANGYS